MFPTLGWNPTPFSFLECVGVSGLCLKSVPNHGMEPHTLQSFKMHWGLRTPSKRCSGPWDGTPHPPVIGNALGSWNSVSQMFWTPGWTPTLSSLLRCIGVSGLSQKVFQTLGWNPTPSSLWKCIGVLGLCLKSGLDPGMEPTPSSP